jgi:arylsulfatase A-like enzyme
MFWKIHSYISDTKSNENRGMKNWLDPNAITMAKIFKENGYRTGHFGKWHLGGGRDVGNAPLPAEYGFDQALVSFEGLGDRILFKNESLSIASEKLGNGKITWVDKHKATEIYVDSTLSFIQRDLDKPFYVHLFPNDVHDPHLPIRASSNKFEKVARSHSEKDFFAVLERLDEQIGRFIYGLDELGKLDNTIIIFTSDNGPTDWPRYYNSGEIPPGSTGGFFGRKWSLYEGGIRMPFIISWPAKIPMGITDEQTIFSSIDLMPSLANLAGVKADFIGDGEDRGRALMGENDNNDRPIMWEYSSAFGGSILPGNDKHISPNLAIRRSQWKLLINVDSTGTELYNLDKDPFESRNVVQNNLDLAQELASIVIQWRRNFLIREIGK